MLLQTVRECYPFLRIPSLDLRSLGCRDVHAFNIKRWILITDHFCIYCKLLEASGRLGRGGPNSKFAGPILQSNCISTSVLKRL